VWAARLPNEGKIRSAALMALDGPWKIDAVSLVHEEEGTFYPAAVGPFRLIHSGDVKIYEFYEALPRAVAVRPGSDAILADLLPNIQPEFITYDMNQIEISVRADDPVRLVLLEANYPGWKVEIDGQPAEIVTVDGFFRGVDLPAGDQKVTFSFRSQPVRTGLVVSLLSFLIWIGAVVYTVGKKEVKKD
nr:YfhO family protein [Ardenticatenaceae bacterium]